MGMITTNPLFLLTKIPKNTRFFITGSVIACYGLFLYELLPEYLFNPQSALYYFVLPTIVIVAILVILPKLFSKNTQGTLQSNVGSLDQISQSRGETISIEQTKEQSIILPDSNALGTMSGTLPGGNTISPNEIPNVAVIQTPAIDEVAIQDMVSRAMEPVQKDSTRIQDTISDLRNEINAIKSSMESLASTVESSLTDLKSFQTELANPLNFMRKYFDSIDIKSLSDPSLPLHIEQLPLSNPIQEVSCPEKTEIETIKDETYDNNSKSKENVSSQITKNHDIGDSLKNDVHEVLSFKQMLGNGITLGRLMTTISLMEEILQTLGRDSIDVLVDQCKIMGLRQEDEHIIYNVVNMMDKSGLSVNDTLIMLYKFGKVMNMNDREADLIYAKLMMNQGKNHDNIMTVEKKAG
jgi:archaellum component FlaC